MKNVFAVSLSLLILVGCQSNDTYVNCDVNTDWQQLGVKTAQSGQDVRTFDQYKNACGSALPEDAQTLYLDGYTAGIKEYCSYENGFERGQKGLQDPKVCPLEIRAEFDKGFRIGSLDRREKKENTELAAREHDRALLSSGAAMSSTGQ